MGLKVWMIYSAREKLANFYCYFWTFLQCCCSYATTVLSVPLDCDSANPIAFICLSNTNLATRVILLSRCAQAQTSVSVANFLRWSEFLTVFAFTVSLCCCHNLHNGFSAHLLTSADVCCAFVLLSALNGISPGDGLIMLVVVLSTSFVDMPAESIWFSPDYSNNFHPNVPTVAFCLPHIFSSDFYRLRKNENAVFY